MGDSNKSSKRKVTRNTWKIIAFVVAYTCFDMSSQHYIHGKYNRMINNTTSAISAIGELRESLNDIDAAAVNLVSSKAGPESITLMDKIENKLDNCQQVMAEYETLSVTDSQKQVYESFKTNFADYKVVMQKIIDAANVEDITLAGTTYKNELIPKKVDTEQTVETLFKGTVVSQNEELEKMAKHRDLNIASMYIIAAIVSSILIAIDRKRARMTQELLDSNKKIEKQKGKLTTAVFTDVLTETFNRMSFVNKYYKDNEKISTGDAAYFAMFNIDDFSSINSKYGVNSGDMVLNSTAERLKEIFGNDKVYRTGSDEFVVSMTTSADSEGYSKISSLVEKAKVSLSSPHRIKNGSLSVAYSISVVRKNGPCSVDSSIIGPLTDSIKNGRMTQRGTIMFSEVK